MRNKITMLKSISLSLILAIYTRIVSAQFKIINPIAMSTDSMSQSRVWHDLANFNMNTFDHYIDGEEEEEDEEEDLEQDDDLYGSGHWNLY